MTLRKFTSEIFLTKQFYIGLFLFLGMMFLFLHARKDGADEDHYLAWGHSLFYDADLLLLNQFEALRLPYFLTPTGFIGELRNIGVAIFWWPFYGLSSAVVSLGPDHNAMRTTVDHPLQLLFINWSTFLYVALSLGIIISVVRQYFSPIVSWFSVGVIFWGTPLFFYTIQHPLSSHPASILLASLFLMMWLKYPRTIWQYFGAGILIGWLMLIASYNAVILLVPLSELFFTVFLRRNWREFFSKGAVLAPGILLGFFPQMLVWRALYGSFTASPYQGQLFWFDSQVLSTLFSPFHGLFIFAPVLFLAALGLIFLARQNKPLAVGIGLTWLALTYIVGANIAWWAGSSFGNRYFLVLSPFFVLLIGALLQHSWRWLWLIIPSVMWTMGLWLQTLDDTLNIDDAHYYSLQTLFTNQAQAWQNIALVIPFHEWWLITISPVVVLSILLCSVLIYFLGYYGVCYLTRLRNKTPVYFLGIATIIITIFVFVLWQRSESQKKLLTETGFYEETHRVSAYDPWNAVRNYTERASYYQATGRSQLILPNLQAAANHWFSSERQILGTTEIGLPSTIQALDLRYGAELRLLGYTWENEEASSKELVLYWEKLAGKTASTYRPFINILDKTGAIVGQGHLEDPFPALYIPPEYYFYDRILIDWQDGMPVDSPLWLRIEFPIENVLAETSFGKTHSGIVPVGQPSRLDGVTALLSKNLPVTYAAPLFSDFRAGEDVGITIVWYNDPFVIINYNAEAQILDQKGITVFKDTVSLFAQGAFTGTHAHKFFADTLCIATPPSLAGGEYQLNLLIEGTGQSQGVPITKFAIRNFTSDVPQSGTICKALQARQAPRQYHTSTEEEQPEAIFSSLAALLDYDILFEARENRIEEKLIFKWHSLINNPVNANPGVRLVDKAGNTVIEHTWLPVWGTRPTPYWFKDEIITDEVILPLPNLPAGQYTLIFEWQTLNGELIKTDDGRTNIILESFSK